MSHPVSLYTHHHIVTGRFLWENARPRRFTSPHRSSSTARSASCPMMLRSQLVRELFLRHFKQAATMLVAAVRLPLIINLFSKNYYFQTMVTATPGGRPSHHTVTQTTETTRDKQLTETTRNVQTNSIDLMCCHIIYLFIYLLPCKAIQDCMKPMNLD